MVASGNKIAASGKVRPGRRGRGGQFGLGRGCGGLGPGGQGEGAHVHHARLHHVHGRPQRILADGSHVGSSPSMVKG